MPSVQTTLQGCPFWTGGDERWINAGGGYLAAFSWAFGAIFWRSSFIEHANSRRNGRVQVAAAAPSALPIDHCYDPLFMIYGRWIVAEEGCAVVHELSGVNRNPADAVVEK